MTAVHHDWKITKNAGPPDQHRRLTMMCGRGCGRIACCASNSEFSEYCCPGCAQGLSHTDRCNEGWRYFSELMVNDFSPGDLVGVDRPSSIPGRRVDYYFAEVCEVLGNGRYAVRSQLLNGKEHVETFVAKIDTWHLERENAR